jgi:hypothetical protein
MSKSKVQIKREMTNFKDLLCFVWHWIFIFELVHYALTYNFI